MYMIISIILIIIICFIGYNIYIKNNQTNTLDIHDNCLYKRFGCCNDKLTPKLDQDGTNCRGF